MQLEVSEVGIELVSQAAQESGCLAITLGCLPGQMGQCPGGLQGRDWIRGGVTGGDA